MSSEGGRLTSVDHPAWNSTTSFGEGMLMMPRTWIAGLLLALAAGTAFGQNGARTDQYVSREEYEKL